MKKTPAKPQFAPQLWMVHLASSYYDNCWRMPGTVPVDCHVFVVADSYDEALRKAEPQTSAKIKEYGLADADTKITAQPFPTELLIPTRDRSNDGRMGWICTSQFSKVELGNEEDRKKFRLAVCLVPVD